jgi:hypothetical protein
LKITQERYRKQVEDIAGFGDSATDALVEAFSGVVNDLLKLEDDGWTAINNAFGSEDRKGMSLEDVKKVTKYLEKQTKLMGGLLGRGLRLKNNHVFGRGHSYKANLTGLDGGKLKTWVENFIHDEDNWSGIFSQGALKELNRILFTSGNLFVMYDSKYKTIDRLAIDINIVGAVTYADNKSRIKYILRSISKNDEIGGMGTSDSIEYVPTFTYLTRLRKERRSLPKSLPGGGADSGKRIPVNQTAVIIEKRVNKDNGETWGVPDAFGAAPWAVLYSTYIKDGAKLQNALAAISYIVKAKTEIAARTAGAKLSQGKVGATAIGGPDTEISQVPRSGAVNLYEGRPIQAQAAAAMDVSVTGLAADPGLGGSYASESALSQPEQLAALSRQQDFVDFFRQIFSAIGAAGAVIDFNRLDVDPIHRSMQSIGIARELGFIHREEGRNRAVELLDIDPVSSDLPDPDEWTGSKVASLLLQSDDDNVDSSSGGSSAIASQGNSGSVGSLDSNGNASRDDTNSMN